MKKLKAGDTLSIRIPNNIDSRILDYLNHIDKNRNRTIVNLLTSKIEEELNIDPYSVKLKLPYALNQVQIKQVENAMSMILNVMDNPDTSESKIDISLFDGMIEDDY